ADEHARVNGVDRAECGTGFGSVVASAVCDVCGDGVGDDAGDVADFGSIGIEGTTARVKKRYGGARYDGRFMLRRRDWNLGVSRMLSKYWATRACGVPEFSQMRRGEWASYARSSQSCASEIWPTPAQSAAMS